MIKFFLPIPFMWLMVFLTYKNRKLMPLLFILNIAYDVASFLVGIEMNIEYNFVSDTYQNFFAFLLGIVWLICLTISELIAVFQKMKQNYKKDSRKFKTVKDEFLWTLTTRATGYILFILLGMVAMDVLAFLFGSYVRGLKSLVASCLLAFIGIVALFGIPALYIIKLDAITNHLDQWLWKKYGNHSGTLGKES